MKIPLKEIPKGILQITLFDDNKEPVAERLAFVNKQKKLKIEVTTNKRSFNSRDSVSLKIVVRDHLNKPVQSEISLSAKDILFDTQRQNQYLADIDNYFSFSSHLHGDWKQQLNNLPTWNEDKTNRVIDLMLLTYGWRKFEWDKLSEVDSLINYELIEGQVTKGKKKAYENIPIHLVSLGTGDILMTNTNDLGHFSFDKHNLMKSATSLVLTSFSEESSSNLRISILENKNHRMPKFTSITNGQIRYQTDLFNSKKNFEILDFAHSQYLQEIVIKEKIMTRNEDPNIKDIRESNVSSKSGEELFPTSDIVGLIRQVSSISYHDVPNNKIYFRATKRTNGALFVIDGFEQGNDYSNLVNLTPDNIEYISVVTGAAGTSIYGSKALDGVVFITTKANFDYAEPEANKNIAFLKGYAKHREFYAPQYKSEAEKNDPMPDLRKTIYWNPKIVTDENGEAIVNYYNADRRTIINVGIQGMSNTGLYGSFSTSYEVLPTKK